MFEVVASFVEFCVTGKYSNLPAIYHYFRLYDNMPQEVLEIRLNEVHVLRRVFVRLFKYIDSFFITIRQLLQKLVLYSSAPG